MAAAAAFCNVNNAYGIKKLRQDNNNLVKNHHLQRNYSTLYAVQGPLLRSYDIIQTRYDQAFTSILRAKQEHARNRSLLECRAERGTALTEQQVEKDEDVSRATLIWRAIKLPMYTVGLIPASVGAAAAYLETGYFSPERYFGSLAAFVLIIAWVNLSNDVYDYDTGADKNKKESVVNLVGSRTAINVIAWLLLVLGSGGLSWVAEEAGSPHSLLLLACTVFCCYIYQCPPFRLSYLGLGEPLCFAAFGPFATIGFICSSGTSELPISSTVISASTLVGFTSSLILLCSHFHRTMKLGKISPLVRLGTEAGANVVKMAVLGLYWLVFAFGLSDTLPYASLIFCTTTLPMGNLVVNFVQENHKSLFLRMGFDFKDKSKIFMAKYFSVRLHTIFGAALTAGLWHPDCFQESNFQS
ncbi:2-carboxy-1,4-naphthoquinone phytyltransferase, chloroplastic [Sesamum angolense]|uniref:2-carboxy-1,4-naphthoquinone phytyltransferase, chloroplastic n=1 Tax=Sesamum angolense TaxID=2727404 RepID=A0AAE1WYA0_9LAMI|nr:2-carboxy-1,4-naphthoquinone phytyltransferase, chloroplastic [Sesamum angolense]